jgi:hypothetical protein
MGQTATTISWVIFGLIFAIAGLGALVSRGKPYAEWHSLIRAAVVISVLRLAGSVIYVFVENALTPLRGILFEEPSPWFFVLVTLVIGGWLAFMTGKVCAETWRNLPQTIAYVLVLGLAVRFVHFALFEGTLFSARFYIADTVLLMIIALAAWRLTTTRIMTTQYWWLYQRTGPFTFAERPAPLSSPPGQS